MFYFDLPHFLFVALPMLVLSLGVQFWLMSKYAQYSRVRNARGITGAEAALVILKHAGIYDVRVEESNGWLSDHFSPSEKVVRLSPQNYHGDSIAAVGVAAHEVGHAIQHEQKYAPAVFTQLAWPVQALGSSLGYLAVVIGLIVTGVAVNPITIVGLVFLAGVVLYQVMILPVEFDASARALKLLPHIGILDASENEGAREILTAAAMTYVAATIAAAWELIFLLLRLGIIGGGSRDD